MSSVGLELLQTVAVILVCVSSTYGMRCEDMSIGVETKGIIPDSSFTASSFYSTYYHPYFARLLDDRGNGWCPLNPQTAKSYLEIDLGLEYFVCAISTKGGSRWEYVNTYSIAMSMDKQNWEPYKEDGKVKILRANSDGSSVVKSSLKRKPLMRHIRLYPIAYYRYKVIKFAVFGFAKFQVCISNPLGMQSRKIPDRRISASTSQQSTSKARLQSVSSWCPSSIDSNPYLQVDLGSDHVICAIATQGNGIADQWVKSYHIWISSNGSSLTPYKVNNVTRTFYGNYDRSTTVRQVLYDSPTARYVHIVPKTSHSSPCLRLEVYGYELEPTCSKHSVGIPSPLIVQGYRFAASSTFNSDYEPHQARLEGTSRSWMAETKNNEHLEIDLGQVFLICAVLTQGDSSGSFWVRKYKLKYSLDNILWKMYIDQNGNEKVFDGNKDRSTIVTHSIERPFKAKFIRVIVPGNGRDRISLRVDFKGTTEACTFPHGIENGQIPDSHLRSSSSLDSSHGASRGRLYGRNSWCSSTSSNAEYIQVDLGRVKTVTGVATQGDHSLNKWVTSYYLNYSYSARIWYEYREDKAPKVLTGNTNRADVIVNWLRQPIAARYVRIVPQTNSNGNCIRFDLYGCDYVISPKVSISKNEITLLSTKGSSQTLTCAVVGEPSPTVQWFRNDTTLIQGATQPSLSLQFFTAHEIVSTYKCERKNPTISPVICKTNYTCVVRYPVEVPSNEPAAKATARVTVNLNVPAKQVFKVFRSKRSLNLTWSKTQPDDVGSITWYDIRVDGMQYRVPSRHTIASFSRLLPYTNYTLQMKATSVVGEGLWSDAQTFATLIAEPEVVPSRVSGKATSSTSIEVSWALLDPGKVNGPLTGFRITCTDYYGRNKSQQGGNVRKFELTQLNKWMEYRITVSVWNSIYFGPESKIISLRTYEDAPECPLQLKAGQALSSTSVRVIWDPLPYSTCRNGILRGYKILMRLVHGNYQMAGKVGPNINSKDIGSLQKFQTYAFTVVAYTVKDGIASNEVTTRTLQDAPSEPLIKEPKLIPPKGQFRVPRVQITWDRPSNENGIIKKYTLVYSYYGSQGIKSNEVYVNITDTFSLVHIMDVVGEAQLWFKLSASTIKEGPYSSFKNLAVPAYAPSISPQAVRVAKQNETTFKIAWQPLPRHKANGVIRIYKIVWIISHIGRAKRMAIGDSFKGTTQGTQFVLHGLRLCAQYEVRIAAATTAGSGPNATVKITTSQPGEPSNVVSKEISKRFVTLSWQKPIGMVEDVKSYKVYYKGSKSYWPAYSSPLKDKSRDGSQPTLKIDDLQPGTLYEFWIIASTVCGESNKSLTVIAETKLDKPYPTQLRAPMDLTDRFNITLWRFKPYNGPISLYQVIVVDGNKNISKIPEDVRNYQMAKENNEPYYITAELTPDDIDSLKDSTIFVIGDNKIYGGYKNVALEKGLVYDIAQRVISIYKGKTYKSDPIHIATIKLSAESTSNAAKSQNNSAMGVAIGVVVPLLIIIVILALLGLKYKRSHSADKDQGMAVTLDNVASDHEDNDVLSNGNKTGNINSGRAQYVNVEASVTASSSEGIYDNDSNRDIARTPMTKRQFLEYMKSLKPTEYAKLKAEFKMLLNTHVFPVDIAKQPANKKKNRYANIVTYDHSRVEINRKLDDENSDYINASYIKGYDGVTKTYIATQGPTMVTVADFWQMIWEQNSHTIVMLTNLKEGSKVKCHQYWPDDKETHRDITITSHKSEIFPDYVRRTLLLAKSNSDEYRQVNHFQFTVWPDKGVPYYSTAVLGLRRKVKAVNPDHAGPLVVHCSAGVGRTGAYIVIDAMLDRARHLKNVSISEYVAAIRNDRPYMVQTDEQYVFIHLALFEAFTCGNTEIPAFNLQATMKKLSDGASPKKSNGFAVEYERLNRVTEDYAQDVCDIGRSPENVHKNRYQHYVALNRCRVLLGKSGEDVITSYINASHVDAYTQRNAFLVTQAPLENTIEDFWIMVVNYDVQTVVMLNNLHEENEHFIQYWPEVGSTSYGYVGVELRDVTSRGQLICRYLNVTYDSTTVQIQHIQMPNWEDKGCPANPQTLLDLMNEVEQSQRHAQSSSSPIVVQCSNGTGRSGTFCAIYSMLERVKEEQIVDVFQAVKRIRANRPGAVETLAQYIFCYKIIESYLDSFSDYANFAK